MRRAATIANPPKTAGERLTEELEELVDEEVAEDVVVCDEEELVLGLEVDALDDELVVEVDVDPCVRVSDWTSGWTSFEVEESTYTLSRYDPAWRLFGTVTVTCPLVSAV